jgi:hypothetical protein
MGPNNQRSRKGKTELPRRFATKQKQGADRDLKKEEATIKTGSSEPGNKPVKTTHTYLQKSFGLPGP